MSDKADFLSGFYLQVKVLEYGAVFDIGETDVLECD